MTPEAPRDAKESGETSRTVFRDRGEIIAALTARNAELEATLAKVAALADEWESGQAPGLEWNVPIGVTFAADLRRAVLASARIGAADTQPEGAGEATIEQTMAPVVGAYVHAHASLCPCGLPEAHLAGGKFAGRDQGSQSRLAAWGGSYRDETNLPTAGSNGDTAPEADAILDCGSEHPTNPSAIPCARLAGHKGSHMSTTGCGGSVMDWPADTAPESGEGR